MIRVIDRVFRLYWDLVLGIPSIVRGLLLVQNVDRTVEHLCMILMEMVMYLRDELLDCVMCELYELGQNQHLFIYLINGIDGVL